jgi:hypothetical protein
VPGLIYLVRVYKPLRGGARETPSGAAAPGGKSG